MNSFRDEPITKLMRDANRLVKYPETYSVAEKNTDAVRIRAAVLGSYSIQHLVKLLRLFLDRENILPEIYEGEYDGVNMDVLDPSSKLYAFKPRFVIILLRHNDFKWES